MDKLKLDDFAKYKFLSSINFSPDGKNCGFIVHQIDLEENKYLSNIYLLDEHRQVKQLTSLNDEKSFIWKDRDTILFSAIREKKHLEKKKNSQPLTVFYQINIHGGEGKFAFELPMNVSSIKIIDQDTYIVSAEFNPILENYISLAEEEKSKAIENLELSKAYEVLDEIPFWSNGDGYTNKKRNKLYLYQLKEHKLTPITDDFSNVEVYSLNQDKSKIVLITSSYIDKMSPSTELNIYDLKENKLEKISPIRNFFYSYCDFLEDKIVFAGSDMLTFGLNENPEIFLSDYTGTYASRISDFDLSMDNSVGSDCRYGSSRNIKVDGNHLYFITTDATCSHLNRMDVHGNIRKITENNGSIDGFDIMDGKIYFIGLRGLNLQEIYSIIGSEERITDFNLWINQEKHISQAEKLRLSLDDTLQIEGFVLKPINYIEGNSYPAILVIHGGPKTVFGDVFFHEMQYWANEGYFVFYCNPRGSDGYGDEFADIRGKYGTIDYDDIMDFTDLVLMKYPDIDKDRIGVTGGSYGGFMTNWIIGHSSRFKAAASQRSISNWISFFGTSDIGYYFADDQTQGNPWNEVSKMWDQSPLKYADKVTTPTLFIHSDEDYRCWIPEGLQMFTALKYHGVESRFITFKGENHELSRSGKPRNRVKRLEEISKWFDKYLK